MLRHCTVCRDMAQLLQTFRTRITNRLLNNLRWASSSTSSSEGSHVSETPDFSTRLKGPGCPLCRNGLESFGYKDVLLLKQFMTPEGLIIGRKKTGVCKRMQRRLDRAILTSRRMGLLPKVGMKKKIKNNPSPQTTKPPSK